MLHLLIFLAYLALFTWLTARNGFFKKTGIPVKWMAVIFLAKVGVACLYGYMYSLQPDFTTRTDTWRFFHESLFEMKALRNDPAIFFKDLFHDPYQSGFRRIFSTKYSYWNDLRNNVMVKMTTIFNLFSFGNYYTNTIFYTFLTLFGPAALYRTFRGRFPDSGATLLIACFFVPSFLFWGSGVHKEGLMMLMLGLFLFHAGRLLNGEHVKSALAVCFLSFFLIFVLRINTLLALCPAAFAWWWSEKKGSRGPAIFAGVHLLFIMLFFAVPHLFPKIDLPMSMHIRQQEFIDLGGRTALTVKPLEPNLSGFIRNLPQAFTIAFLHPFPGEGGAFYIPFTLEIGLLILMFLSVLLFPDRKALRHPLLLFSLFFAVSMLLTIGYIVPNIGAVVRYRSIGMPFLFLFALLGTDWNRARRLFQSNTH